MTFKHLLHAGVIPLLALVAACTQTPMRHEAPPSADGGHGRMSGYVESQRATDFCPDQNRRRADERCVVTRGWDYAAGVGIQRVFDPQGRRISEEVLPGADLSLTPAERRRVEDLVRADPQLAPIINQPGVRVWAGGFVVREPGDPYCDRGSRCVRAIAGANDGNDAVAHAVVDLMTDRVVYPFYSPEPNAKARSDIP